MDVYPVGAYEKVRDNTATNILNCRDQSMILHRVIESAQFIV